MIEDAEVTFSNGNTADVERVKFKNGGWIGVRTDSDWAYYPPDAVDRVVSRDGDAQ